MMTNNKAKRKRYQAQNQKSAYLFIMPSMIILSVFVFIPLIASFVISITDMNIFMKDVQFVGLKNFFRLFEDDRVRNATFNSLYFTLLEVPLQVGLALLLTVCLSKNSRYSKLLRSVYYLPFVCSMTAIGIVWSMLLDPNMGLIAYWLKQAGLETIAFLKDPKLAMPTVIAVTAWKGIRVYVDFTRGSRAQYFAIAVRGGGDGRRGKLLQIYPYHDTGYLADHQLLHRHFNNRRYADV